MEELVDFVVWVVRNYEKGKRFDRHDATTVIWAVFNYLKEVVESE